MHLMAARRRDERGAVAVMFAFMASLLLVFAALAVDIGNLTARRTWTQAQADHAALAGGAELLETARLGGTPPVAVVDEVTKYLNANAPQQDDDPCWRNTPADCVTASQLTNGNGADGEVRYTDLGLQVEAPHAWVDFGLAGVAGFDGADVTGTATVQIKTGGLRTMPMYGVAGCDWGRQTLVDPSNDPAPVVPTLDADGETNVTELTADSQVLTDAGLANVETLTLNSTGNLVSFKAKKFNTTRKIGFFPSDGGAPVEQDVFWLQSDATRQDLSKPADPTTYTTNNSPDIMIQALVPDTVAASEQVWWIRVWNQAAGQWSNKSQALPIRVGSAVLECSSASNEGNFGTLRLPRTTPTATSQWLPANIALGLQKPITPTIHRTPAADGICTDGVNNAVVSWQNNPHPGTNCVGTDPGVASTVLDQGLITGGTGYVGLLDSADTKDGCSPDGDSDERTVNFPSYAPFRLNDDVLTCFLTDGTTSLADIANPHYSGPQVLDKSIYDSPRFFYVPVLKQDPGTGAQAETAGHSIIDYRPAFLTDEEATASAIKGSHTGTTDNGIKIENSGVVQMRVFFFNFDALPTDADTDSVMDYLGVGPKILRLVD